MLGTEVATLVNENKGTGVYLVNFNGNDLASGAYIYTIKVDALNESGRGYTMSRKMLLLK
jgi:hypothetical protein